ncbi:hypothetical protein PG984_003882 [Apiospora sp. TS-2023a]
MGCVQQFQWCRDPAQRQCGNLGSRLDALYSAAPWLNVTKDELDADRPVLKTKIGSLLIWAYYILNEDLTNISGPINTLGSASLASNSLLTQGKIPSLQRNQWQLDVERWWQIVLAGFQARFVNTAQGSAVEPKRRDRMEPASDFDWSFCHNQKIRSAQHDSFSIFGLVFTYLVGLIIVIISFTIEPILWHLQGRGRYSKYAYLEWVGGTAIQLHRMAQEQLGNGHWTNCDDTIPITQPEDMLGPFDISNPEHPILARTVEHNVADVAEEIKPGTTSQHSTDEQTSQESSFNHGDGHAGTSPVSVRRPITDARFQFVKDATTWGSPYFEAGYFVDIQHVALLHIATAIYPAVIPERIFAFAEPVNCDDIMAIFRGVYPARSFPAGFQSEKGLSNFVPRKSAKRLLHAMG